MDADLKKIKKLTAFMRKNGLLTLKQDGIELSLSPLAIDLAEKGDASDAEKQTQSNEPLLTDMDVLLWSAPGNIEDMQ